MEITKKEAEIIIEMDNICYGESIGPWSEGLILKIIAKYPELSELSLAHKYEYNKNE